MIVGLWESGNIKGSWSRACLVQWYELGDFLSLRSRLLEVGPKGRTGAREAPSRAPFFSCAYYFQAPASQAKLSVAEQIQLAVKAGLELGVSGI